MLQLFLISFNRSLCFSCLKVSLGPWARWSLAQLWFTTVTGLLIFGAMGVILYQWVIALRQLLGDEDQSGRKFRIAGFSLFGIITLATVGVAIGLSVSMSSKVRSGDVRAVFFSTWPVMIAVMALSALVTLLAIAIQLAGAVILIRRENRSKDARGIFAVTALISLVFLGLIIRCIFISLLGFVPLQGIAAYLDRTLLQALITWPLLLLVFLALRAHLLRGSFVRHMQQSAEKNIPLLEQEIPEEYDV